MRRSPEAEMNLLRRFMAQIEAAPEASILCAIAEPGAGGRVRGTVGAVLAAGTCPHCAMLAIAARILRWAADESAEDPAAQARIEQALAALALDLRTEGPAPAEALPS